MEDNKFKIFEIAVFVYFFIGTVCGLLIAYTQIRFEFLYMITCFYMYTVIWSSLIYLTVGCLFYKHRYFLMNIIDGALCFCLTALYPYPVYIIIYRFNKYLYYFLGGCFSLLPLIFCIMDKTKIDLFHIFKIITRIFMIVFMIVTILLLKSCGIFNP